MRILAIDTSGMAASAAVMNDDNLIGEWFIHHKKTHSQTLMPIIDQLLKAVELHPADIDLFAVSIGPGSFTGLRIGTAVIKGMAQALDKPVIGVPTLDGLAYNLPLYQGIICPIIDARRNNVYTSIYRFEESALVRQEDYLILEVDKLLEIVNAQKGTPVFLGDGVLKYRDYIIKGVEGRADFAPGNLLLQRASSIAMAALERVKRDGPQTFAELTPMYLRPSQAEREYKRCKR